MRRGRKAAQLEGLSQYNFDKLAKTEGTASEKKRFLAFAHIQDGKSFTEAAAAVRVALRSLMEWINRFRKEGINGLRKKPGRGAKPLVPKEQLDAFREAVLDAQNKKIGGRIRGRDVMELMKQNTE